VSDLLGPAEVQDLLADPAAPERCSPLTGAPLLAIDLRTGASLASEESAARLGGLPCVSVVLRSPAAGRSVPPLAAAADVVVDSESELASLAERIRARPLASLALAQLLRLGERLSLGDALVAESLVYSMLQSGPEYRAWGEARPPEKPRPEIARPAVRVERTDGRLRLILDRPEKRNAFSARMRDELCEGLRLALADASVESLELRGEGPDFCSGGDLDEFGTLPDPVTAHAIRTTRSAAALLVACAPRARASLQGACVGAGVELPAFCARVEAREDASFRLPEVGMGLIPGAGGTASLPRRIGRQRTARLALGGEAIDARTAQAWGLVDAILRAGDDWPGPGVG
jgi:enoyl-CoA hydratase/carnithine racemase